MGKGSKPRPMEIDRSTYESNWDRIFENENPLEGTPMWKHYCAVNGTHLVAKGEHCNWCGENEFGELDYE